MKDKEYITADDLSSETTLLSQVNLNRSTTVALLSGNISTISNKRLSTASLVIIDEKYIDELKALWEKGVLDSNVPILILSHHGNPLPFTVSTYEHRLVDFLSLPTTLGHFHHRIFFLNRLRQLSVENHNHATTMTRQLAALYSRDGLTGLFNRRHLTNQLREIFVAAQKEGTQLSILLLNIDYFNNINKSLGFHFGDNLLNNMAARLTENTREVDSCYRFSGEDFIVLMPGADLATSNQVAEQLSKSCAEKPFAYGNQKKFITVSIGLASLKDHRPADDEEFICMAETALFMAKAEGRNRIKVYAPPVENGYGSPKKTMSYLNENLSRILEKTRRSAIASLQLLAKTVAGPVHQDHIDKVSRFIDLLGEQLGLPEHHIQTFHNSATLYNSFRFLLHNDILSKPGQLSASEYKLMSDLPFKLAEVTDMFDYFSHEKGVLQNHCERYDGSGYPNGLKGDEIPLGARIFNIVNSLAAMSAERPYRRNFTPREILEELCREAGKQFDPRLVLHILQMIEKNRVLEINTEYISRLKTELLNTFPELTS